MGLKSSNKVSPSFNMSSMTDLVFLLLIFFIIVSTLVSPFALSVDLPSKGKGGPPDKNIVNVRISARSEHYVNDRLVTEENLERVLLSSITAGNSERKVSLKIDKTVPTGLMVNVLDIAKRNDCKIVLKAKAN